MFHSLLPNAQEEVRSIQSAFNAKFKEVKAAKQKEIDRIEERLGRVAEIQVGAGPRLLISFLLYQGTLSLLPTCQS